MELTKGEHQIKLLENDGCADPTIAGNGTNNTGVRMVPKPDSSIRIAKGLVSDGAGFSCLTINDDHDAEEIDLGDDIPPLFMAIKIGDIRAIESIIKEDPKLVNNPKYSGYPSIHYACKHNNIMALRRLLENGANIEAHDAFGNTSLHLAVSLSWHEGIAELLSHGASPDGRNVPPKSVREIQSETPLQAAIRIADLISVSLLLEHKAELEELDSDQATVLHLAAQTRNMMLLNILLKQNICREMIGKKDCRGNSIFHAVLQQECFPENEITCVQIYQKFISIGASMYIDDTNGQGESPLFRAVQLKMPKLVEFLLSAKSDPTKTNEQGQSLIHTACHSGCAVCLSHLLKTGLLSDQVTQADKNGKEPFHYAVHSCSIDCCELLLTNGDHLTRRDSDGVSRFSLILKQLPSATQLLLRLFDSHIRLSNKPHHDPDFHIIFDYSGLLSEDKKVFQSSLISEFTASHLDSLVKHPLLESFLYLKWQRIKTFFYLGVFMYFLYLTIHSLFLTLIFGHVQLNFSNERQTLRIFAFLHIFMFILILIPDTMILLANFKKYLWHIETYTKAVALLSSAVVLYFCSFPTHIYLLKGYHYLTDDVSFPNGNSSKLSLNYDNFTASNITYDISKVRAVRYAAAISSLFGWLEFMMLLGRFPILGVYVLMFTRVAKTTIKFVIAFSSLLIGFALCFMVLMNESPVFKSFPLSLVKTLLMMNGEIEYSELYESMQMPVVSLIAVASFIFLACIIMANLLVALAVNDIPYIQHQGKIRRLAKQAAFLVSYDKLITIAYNSRYFPKFLRRKMSNRSFIARTESIYPNLNSEGKNFKRSVPSETIREAIIRGSSHDTRYDFTHLEDDDMNVLFKSFRQRYNKDRKLLQEKLQWLPENMVSERMLKEHLDHLQLTMENRFAQLALQISQQLQQNHAS